MSAGRIGVLVTLYSLQQILGHILLPSPRNVTLLSKDFGVALTWLPGEGSPPDVLYSVRYKSLDHKKQGKKVRHCKNISQTTCNLTCVADPYIKYSASVKAVSAGRQSLWVESGFMEYHFDVALAPPALEVSMIESTIHVNATFPLASCVESTFIGLKYDLDLWEAGTEDKQKRYSDNMKWETVTINTLPLSGNYCLNARASFQALRPKHSEFSKPVCMLLKPKAMDWKFLITTAVPLLVLLSLSATVASVLYLCKQAAKREKRPQALDFSRFRTPGKILEKEPNEKELFEKDFLICTGKPAPGGRRSSLSARNNVSLMSSLPSLSEEEEDDDSGGFRPYTEMPRFLKRSPSCQASSGNQEGSPSGSELCGSHLERGSVPDLGGLGFSQFVWRGGLAKQDTSGFQGSEKSFLSKGSSLADFFLTEARYPATSAHGRRDMYIDMCQRETFLQISVLTEALSGKPPTDEQCLPTRGPHFINHQQHHYPEPIVCVATEVSEDSDGFPFEEQLVCFQTLKLADDEDVASDSDSPTVCSEEDPSPQGSVLSEAFEAETQGKGGGWQQESDPKFKFQGCQHVHYMPRN
ncbi:interferon lambda receptor 1 [Emydura macquarii macquarii]|uniref:interferon lambda receptor 1 n=1 Tax=Emydura macquarii macquarii TaxID=1129001 RepID=UPI00352B472E